MLHAPITPFEKLEGGDVITAVLGALVAAMSFAVAVLIYLPLR